MAKKGKTWSELIGDLTETFRKWTSVTFESVEIDNDLPPRSRQKRVQSVSESEVRLRFVWFGNARREVRADVRLGTNATENLRLIATAVEMIRLAEVRGVSKILATCYRQMYPVQQSRQANTPPPQTPRIPPHYAVLHIAPGAPLEVAEAAYRALAKQNHPDRGGSPEAMQRLNAAIERIREESEAS